MKFTDAPLHCAGLLLAAMLAAGSLAAATLELPTEWPLGVDSQLFFELDGVDLHLATRVEGLPVLKARAAVAGESASLEFISSGGSLTVRRVGGGEGVPPEGGKRNTVPEGGKRNTVPEGGKRNERVPRLRIDVALGPGRTVHVAGADLAVRAEDTLPDGSGGVALRLALERSTAKLSGVRISELQAVASSVTLTGNEGALALTLTGGTTQVQGHQGRLELVATGADVAVVGHQGQIVPDLEGGSLEISGGEGTFSATVAGAHLSFDDWRGPVEVRARDTVIEARGAEHRDRWQIDGSELQVILDRVWGTIQATLEGGRLSASDLSAAVEVTAGGSRLDLTEVVGSVTLALTEDAEAVVAGVAGGVEAEVIDSRLEVERVDRLKLTGAGADVSARGVARLEPLELSDSQLALDLRDSRPGAATLELRGAGYAGVQLQEPCIVQLTAEAALDHQVETTGCELRAFGEEVSRRQDRLRYGDLPLARLSVTIDRDAVVDVEGEP